MCNLYCRYLIRNNGLYLLRIYYMLGTVLSILHILCSTAAICGRFVLTHINEELRYKEVK